MIAPIAGPGRHRSDAVDPADVVMECEPLPAERMPDDPRRQVRETTNEAGECRRLIGDGPVAQPRVRVCERPLQRPAEVSVIVGEHRGAMSRREPGREILIETGWKSGAPMQHDGELWRWTLA